MIGSLLLVLTCVYIHMCFHLPKRIFVGVNSKKFWSAIFVGSDATTTWTFFSWWFAPVKIGGAQSTRSSFLHSPCCVVKLQPMIHALQICFDQIEFVCIERQSLKNFCECVCLKMGIIVVRCLMEGAWCFAPLLHLISVSAVSSRSRTLPGFWMPSTMPSWRK